MINRAGETGGAALNGSRFSCVVLPLLLLTFLINIVFIKNILYDLMMFGIPDILFKIGNIAASSFLVFAAAGLMYGAEVFYIHILRRGTARLSLLFYAFGSVSLYCRALTLFARRCLHAVFCFFPAILFGSMSYLTSVGFAGYYVAEYTDYRLNEALALPVLRLLTALALLFGIRRFSRYTLSVFLTIVNENDSVGKCFHDAKRMRKRYAKTLADQQMHFVPVHIAGICSLGVAYILFGVSYMRLSSFALCEEIIHTRAASENSRYQSVKGDNIP